MKNKNEIRVKLYWTKIFDSKKKIAINYFVLKKLLNSTEAKKANNIYKKKTKMNQTFWRAFSRRALFKHSYWHD